MREIVRVRARRKPARYKNCEICGIQIEKHPQDSLAQWQSKRFCSHACKGKWVGDDRSLPVGPRLLARIVRDDATGCWLWTGILKTGGYGVIKVRGKNVATHRASYEAFVGAIPDGTFVLHRCDVRHCINPDHLFLGSQTDNMRDMVSKDRMADCKGERNPRSALTPQQVLEIRRSTAPRPQLAREYGVTNQSIRAVQLAKTWKHL